MLPFDVLRLTNMDNLLPVKVDASLPTWNGGTFVQYQKVTTVQDAEAFRVDRYVSLGSPTTVVGFLLRGSYEASDQRTSQNPGITRIATFVNFGSHLFKYYEPDIFVLNQTVYCSVNGLLTNVDAGGARAVGVVMGLPADNAGYLGADILFP
jgi:hypothetical protein